KKTSGPQSLTLPFGLIVGGDVGLDTGAALEFTLTGEAGIEAKLKGQNGTVSVEYPMAAKLTFPDPRTLRPGDTFTIGSSFEHFPGGNMSSTSPDWGFRLEAILNARLRVRIVVALLGDNVVDEELYDSGTLDLSSNLFDTDLPGFKEGVDKGSGEFNLL